MVKVDKMPFTLTFIPKSWQTLSMSVAVLSNDADCAAAGAGVAGGAFVCADTDKEAQNRIEALKTATWTILILPE